MPPAALSEVPDRCREAPKPKVQAAPIPLSDGFGA
jgi:hypothetical protein